MSLLHRRTFLWQTAQGAAGLAVLALPGCTGVRDDIGKQARALTWWIPPNPSTRSLGRRYLELTPRERSLRTLVGRILDPLDREDVYHAMEADPDALRKELHRCSREDFRRGETLHIDRWLLSRTEARLCAIVALRHGPWRIACSR